jgi:hypothetical protein
MTTKGTPGQQESSASPLHANSQKARTKNTRDRKGMECLAGGIAVDGLGWRASFVSEAVKGQKIARWGREPRAACYTQVTTPHYA